MARPRKTTKNCLPENWQEIILEKSAQGCSQVEIRAHLCLLGGKFNHDTWYALKDREEEFSETIKKSEDLCQAWWERQGRENLKAKFFQTGCWYANMKNRFGWRDNRDTNLGIENAEQYFKTIANAISGIDTDTEKVL